MDKSLVTRFYALLCRADRMLLPGSVNTERSAVNGQ